MESIRHSAEDAAWPIRPWLWAIVCAAGAFTVYQLVDMPDDPAIWRQVAATFIIIATLAFVLTSEQRRFGWALAFAGAAGAVMAFVGWFTAAYNKGGEIAEYPFLAGLFALLIAAPLFQTARDEGGWRFPYSRLHGHVWTDAVIGAASLAFTGVSFLLAFLIAQLFDLIGIEVFSELLREGWFNASLMGFAFGAALGLLREWDALLATLQKLVLVVFSVLAPVLAFALVGFLLSLPFTGLKPLWDSNVPTTPVLLLAAAGAVGLINAVIGDGKAEGSHNRVLRWSALLLSVCILPLAVIAGISMAARIQQYGFTPDRIWGLLAIIVACVYGVAYLVSAAQAARAKAPLDWDDHIRPANIRIALGVCALALFLALPILDFGAMSAKDQLVRLKSGVTKAGEFDWQAMAFDFGPKGRAVLQRLSKTGTEFERKSSKAALASDNRWNVDDDVKVEQSEDWDTNFVYDPPGKILEKSARETVVRDSLCRTPCRILWLNDNRFAVVGTRVNDMIVGAYIYNRLTQAEADAIYARRMAEENRYAQKPKVMVWERDYDGLAKEKKSIVDNITPQTRIEIRTVEMQQVFVDGQPVGDVIPK
jgi:hypothetical protein